MAEDPSGDGRADTGAEPPSRAVREFKVYSFIHRQHSKLSSLPFKYSQHSRVRRKPKWDELFKDKGRAWLRLGES